MKLKFVAVVIAVALAIGFRTGDLWRQGIVARAEAVRKVSERDRTVATYLTEQKRVEAEQAFTYNLGETLNDTADLDTTSVVFSAERMLRLYRPAP